MRHGSDNRIKQARRKAHKLPRWLYRKPNSIHNQRGQKRPTGRARRGARRETPRLSALHINKSANPCNPGRTNILLQDRRMRLRGDIQDTGLDPREGNPPAREPGKPKGTTLEPQPELQARLHFGRVFGEPT